LQPAAAKWGTLHILAVPHLSRGWSEAKATNIGQILSANCGQEAASLVALAGRAHRVTKPHINPSKVESPEVKHNAEMNMTKDDLDSFIRNQPGVFAKDKKSRTSYWRSDGARFCKIEQLSGGWVIVFTDLSYAKDGHLLPNSEQDRDGRLMLRLTNSQRIEAVKILIAKRSK
jgi:hypothetical protein